MSRHHKWLRNTTATKKVPSSRHPRYADTLSGLSETIPRILMRQREVVLPVYLSSVDDNVYLYARIDKTPSVGNAMLTVTPFSLGTYIRDCRKQKHWSQTELARVAGLTQQTVSSFENDAKISSITTLYKILMALDLEMVVQPKPPLDNSGLEW